MDISGFRPGVACSWSPDSCLPPTASGCRLKAELRTGNRLKAELRTGNRLKAGLRTIRAIVTVGILFSARSWRKLTVRNTRNSQLEGTHELPAGVLVGRNVPPSAPFPGLGPLLVRFRPNLGEVGPSLQLRDLGPGFQPGGRGPFPVPGQYLPRPHARRLPGGPEPGPGAGRGRPEGGPRQGRRRYGLPGRPQVENRQPEPCGKRPGRPVSIRPRRVAGPGREPGRQRPGPPVPQAQRAGAAVDGRPGRVRNLAAVPRFSAAAATRPCPASTPPTSPPCWRSRPGPPCGRDIVREIITASVTTSTPSASSFPAAT